MKFTNETDPATLENVGKSDVCLTDPARLEALKRTGMLDTPSEEAFDRLTKLAAKILRVPLSIISLVDRDRHYFKSDYGLTTPYDKIRQIPIDGSICRYTLAGESIIADDAKNHDLLRTHPAVTTWGVGAIMVIPLMTKEGHALGAFCAVDPKVRHWTDDEIDILKELTAAAMSEIELRGQLADLEIDKKWRDQLVTTLTHDLRSPLHVAKIASDTLDRELSQPERQKFTRMISENMDRADAMIRDLLDVSLLKAGKKVQLDLRQCHLQDLMAESVEGLNFLYRDRFVLHSAVDMTGYWDPKAVRRLVENLAINGIKHGAVGAPVTITTAVSPEEIEIRVHNEGTPIPQEHFAALFEPFKHLDTTRPQKGWGVGLALVYAFTKAHGGEISVESSAIAGTTFTVRLPKDCREN